MKISCLRVKNFRALRDVEIPLSQFTCLVGENNAGKSTVLRALDLFLTGGKVEDADRFDPAEPVRIEVRLEGIDERDLARIGDAHRERIAAELVDGALRLIRIFPVSGKASLKLVKLMPREPRFHSSTIEQNLKGKTRGELLAHVQKTYPELADRFQGTVSQATVREVIQEYVRLLPGEAKEWGDDELPVPESSIAQFLPEPIFIPAVKDLASDVKTADRSPFGKLLGLLLEDIKGEFGETEKLFHDLQLKLTRVDGEDHRLPQVRDVEAAVRKHLRQSFPQVSVALEIPPPELRTVLSGARFKVDDGVEGEFETKGDGLKRALVFSILRTYVEQQQKRSGSDGQPQREDTRPWLLLFEEPELYLHPKAQSQLVEALGKVAERHAVVITTHSPAFLDSEKTKTFVKLVKRYEPGEHEKPSTQVCAVDFTGIKDKDLFQVICYENNEAAFFSDVVLLVEGDVDHLVISHLAKTLNPVWDFKRRPVEIVRMEGKKNVRRYRDFFSRFDIRVAVLVDLDAIVDGFELLGAGEVAADLRKQLMKEIETVARHRRKQVSLRNPIESNNSGKRCESLWSRVSGNSSAS
ncbi:ATP-dependent endonuclease [Carbonactinospora thermoautotrophica]|uniref:ATP-dependent nuclease n=1 Tax=Carbonactinospora thermoautotrophica TaxID=1469144 RepID=UPI00226F543A|nr:ATP-dependent endonuclease [Carbonactinospora thermoautotrophica]MCX9193444.1 ATP-dependent endonuclease [Carbonactinospora thermoautotrophica]